MSAPSKPPATATAKGHDGDAQDKIWRAFRLPRLPVSLRVRVMILIGSLVVVVLVDGALLASASRDQASAGTFLTETALPLQQQAVTLTAGLIDQETGLRGYLLGGDKVFLKPYRTGASACSRALTALRQESTTLPQLATDVSIVDGRLSQWQQGIADSQISARERGPLSLQQLQEFAAVGKVRFDSIRSATELLSTHVQAMAAQATSARDDAVARTQRAQAVIFATLLLALLGVALLLSRWVLRPARRLVVDLTRVAEGDLDHRVRTGGPAEISAVAAAAEHMRRRLVHELDATRRAEEALRQQVPAVARLRILLDPPSYESLGEHAAAGRVLPAEGVLAGDWWDLVHTASGPVIVLADVSGHGAESGVLALHLKASLRTSLANGLSLDESLAVAAEEVTDPERLATALLIRLEDGALVWAGAGSPTAYVIHAEPRGSVVELTSTGPPISMLGGKHVTRSTPLRNDDLVISWTDGVVEARSPDGTMLDDEPLLAAVRDCEDWDPRVILELLIDLVDDHAAGRARADDQTIVVLGRA